MPDKPVFINNSEAEAAGFTPRPDTRVLFRFINDGSYIMTNDRHESEEQGTLEMLRVCWVARRGSEYRAMHTILFGSWIAHDPEVVENIERIDITLAQLEPGLFE